MQVTLRPAEPEDVPALTALIADSVMVLQAPDYSEAQRRGALGTVFGVDSRLIADKTYFVAQSEGIAVGCGGWSRRRTLFGGDAIAGKDDQELDPARDAARIRAFFVKPGWTRRGIGGQILAACEAAAQAAGFSGIRADGDLDRHRALSRAWLRVSRGAHGAAAQRPRAADGQDDEESPARLRRYRMHTSGKTLHLLLLIPPSPRKRGPRGSAPLTAFAGPGCSLSRAGRLLRSALLQDACMP